MGKRVSRDCRSIETGLVLERPRGSRNFYYVVATGNATLDGIDDYSVESVRDQATGEVVTNARFTDEEEAAVIRVLEEALKAEDEAFGALPS